MQYLTVGRSELKGVRPVENNYEPSSLKPLGGLWLTKYETERYNSWIDYLLGEMELFYFKSRNHSIWRQPCSVVMLKENANLLSLSNHDELVSLSEKYPLVGNEHLRVESLYDSSKKFSYEDISKLYDGIYFNLSELLLSEKDNAIYNMLYKFSVSSLVLFNADCIDYYQSGVVMIEPFDFEYEYNEGTTYEIKLDSEKKKILTK